MDYSAAIQQLKIKEAEINCRLNKITGTEDSHLDGVAKHFHLGMVGGSGRNTQRLNQRRERSLEKSIAAAKEATALNNNLATVQAKIKDLESGGPERRAAQAEIRLKARQVLKEREKQGRKNMTPEQRLFIGDYPGGMVYADKSILKNGDYKRLAFASHPTKKLEWEATKILPALKELIEAHHLGSAKA